MSDPNSFNNIPRVVLLPSDMDKLKYSGIEVITELDRDEIKEYLPNLVKSYSLSVQTYPVSTLMGIFYSRTPDGIDFYFAADPDYAGPIFNISTFAADLRDDKSYELIPNVIGRLFELSDVGAPTDLSRVLKGKPKPKRTESMFGAFGTGDTSNFEDDSIYDDDDDFDEDSTSILSDSSAPRDTGRWEIASVKGTPTKRVVSSGKTYTFGRSRKEDPEKHFTLNDTTVSRVHLRVEFHDGYILAEDLASSNGTKNLETDEMISKVGPEKIEDDSILLQLGSCPVKLTFK